MVSFHIVQSYNPDEGNLCRIHADAFTRMTVLNELSSLRSVTLRFHHDHPELATSMIINTKLTYLELLFYGTQEKISIYSLIPLLRMCTALRKLNVMLKATKSEDNYINTPNLLSVNEHESSTISPLKRLELQIFTQFDVRSLNSILPCVPNLEEFCVNLVSDHMNASYMDLLVDGHSWQRLFTSHVANLKKFDFHMSFLICEKLVDSTMILHSFNYFQKHYDSWHMAVSRWKILEEFMPYEQIVLRTLNYRYLPPRYKCPIEVDICCNTVKIISSDMSNGSIYRYQSHNDAVTFYMPTYMEKQNIEPSSKIPFRNVNFLTIDLSFELLDMSQLFQSIYKSIFTHSYENESYQYVKNLSSLIDLSTVSTLKFEHTNNPPRLYVVPHVLLACVNVTKLIMPTSLFFSSDFIDDPYHLLAFGRITQLNLVSDYAYLPPKCGSKIVERFPSLSYIETDVYSLDCTVPLVDIFVGGLKMLRHLVMGFSHEGLIDDAISRDHVIEKRRQSFGLNRNDECKVVVKIEDHNTLYIWIP
ncbi:unnamed protein product [Adineta ricciae]|uniref:Uncharacterized protein n=1 Tax=Adineta ricciae TaxID=249248 RepID=A0A815E758_ADIRI|nr:unnamed protein product [Adineta ricciae]CAF1644455.1 unnamed protein product [Adineta ricciae]